MVTQDPSLAEPLLEENGSEGPEEYLTSYEDAGLFRRVGFSWMNDLLVKGSQRALEVKDIPHLGPENDAEASHGRLLHQWDETVAAKRNLGIILVNANWATFVWTGSLGVLRLCVMFAGPLLIQRFIDFTSQADTFWLDGLKIVAVLFMAKMTEGWASHQCDFHQARIEISVWSALVAAVYRKGLKISGRSRKAHGLGKIINYMSVDSRGVAEFFVHLHEMWIIPIQICLALAILYSVVGAATAAGVAIMVIMMMICLLIAAKQKDFQVHNMASRDARLKATNEALSHMKIIKLCDWQMKFLERVENARSKERVWISKSMYVKALSIFFLWFSPLAVSIFTFGTCIVLGIPLTPGRVFTAIATFRILQDPIRAFPSLIMVGVQALVSARRLTHYLESEELDATNVEKLPWSDLDDHAIVVKSGIFTWEFHSGESPTLSNINLEVKRGSLVAVVGPVGSGKTALLNSILGEMEKLSGSVSVSGKVAYVPQSAWIQNGTIKDNILFGKSLDEDLYKETIRVCALEDDLLQLTFGDNTEIGERGINLSGGQKQRVQLARAVYQDADIYLLDDIFSAVDAHTASLLFQQCILGTLAGKAVLLVTHQVDFLRGADSILVMRGGEIAQCGNYEDLSEQGLDFRALVDAHNESQRPHDAERDEAAAAAEEFSVEKSDLFYSTLDTVETLPAGQSTISAENSSIQEAFTTLSQQLESEREQNGHEQKIALQACVPKPAFAPTASQSSRLIEEEEREEGRVGSAVYCAYATKVFFGFHVVLLLLVQTGWQSLQIASDFWLANSTSAENQEKFNPSRFMRVYAELAVGSGLFVLVRSLIVAFCGLKTAQKFFEDMIRIVFRAPMSFFDTTPSGRILTRSSTDQVAVDSTIPSSYGSCLTLIFQLLGILVIISQVTWQMVIVILPLSVIFLRYQTYFLSTSRELTRLVSITEAPIIQNFSETLSGAATIRAFDHQERFILSNLALINTNLAIQFHTNAANEWLGFRLDIIGSILLCSSALLLVLLPKDLIRPERVGLSLSYGLALNNCLLWLVPAICAIEQKMVAVERILQYTLLPSEAPLVIAERRPPTSWPTTGSITMTNVQLRYRVDTPLVLKGVSFSVRGEKLGVVGKTGSGKSSLILALFRIVELAGGSIVIDGLDISMIGLSDLRSKLSIIPQEPTLFEGTVRTNVDPLEEHTDSEVWEALEKSQLAELVRDKNLGLDFPVAESGQNWSVGQRQLFCLSRALLKRSKILVLDEATASVDTQTDLVVQKTLSQECALSTVLCIAHRIPSVMSSNKILVIDDGLVLEFGTPSSLLDKPSFFSSLVREYWKRSGSLHDLAASG